MAEAHPAAAAPRRPRTWEEIQRPEGAAGGWRDLPLLLGHSLRLLWQAGRREFLLNVALQLVQAVSLTAQLFVTRRLLGTTLAAPAFSRILPSLAALVALTVAVRLAGILTQERNRVLGELVARRALEGVLDVSTRVDLLAFESPDFYDRLQRARAQGQFRALQTVQAIVGLVGAAVTAAGLVAGLTALQPLLIPVVVAGYVPLWIVTRLNSRDFYVFAFGMTPNDRQRGYLQGVMLERGPAKEVRAFDLPPFLRGRYDRLYDERIAELRALARRRTLRSLAGAAGQSLLTAGAIAALAWLYVSGRMTAATAGAAVFGLYQLASRLSAFHFNLSTLYEATLFVRDHVSFLELAPAVPERPSRAAPRSFGRLVVDGVGFTYPDAHRPALDGVTLEIAAGEVVALVGENGSGKTTLAKIVAGLYRPQTGRVLWDGEDVSAVDPDELRDSIAVIFQDFEQYLLPAFENVGVGRHERIGDRAAIRAAAERADAESAVAGLPDGWETMLGREFLGGYDLSVGQWQRIALARAIFRDAPLVILDEPTAALDARSESRLFTRMRELLEGRAALLISHRFSSVRSADRIYVLREGAVVEHGTHDELVAANGLYAELFSLQAAAYL